MAVVFQPIVDLRDESVAGVEALSRFADGRTPEEHLAQARARGTLVELELSLLADIRRAAAAIPDGWLITCNASGPTFDALENERVAFDRRLRWGLELSELSAPAACAAARRISTALGCLLLLDDAGAAHSTVERIQELRPDIVKLDRFIVATYEDDVATQALAARLCDAARAVGARLLVEGIETPRQAALARDLGAEYAQGYLFGRPAPIA
ncbi:EAL domain-containing protein [Microbacterium nymphoidis]|uniref:EAL domain-containing protein n=1 Tax=Microbacterium nymphoidis TaxID=2898586 RepID=UPI001E516DC4|nr:EAL domain-containing protein [Microbacterium nymphoidis]MCD2497073.1 EAL domain-containing protein [Microbacterium nymphoidis]